MHEFEKAMKIHEEHPEVSARVVFARQRCPGCGCRMHRFPGNRVSPAGIWFCMQGCGESTVPALVFYRN